MTFDTTTETEYMLKFLDERRDEIQDSLRKLEQMWTDAVALHDNPDFQRLTAELDLNATLTVRVMNDQIQIKRELQILAS